VGRLVGREGADQAPEEPAFDGGGRRVLPSGRRSDPQAELLGEGGDVIEGGAPVGAPVSSGAMVTPVGYGTRAGRQ